MFLRRTYWPWTPWGQGQAGTLWSGGNGQSHQPRKSHDQCPRHHDCSDCRPFSYVQLWRLHPQGKHNIWYVMIPIWTGCSKYINIFLIICLHFCITHPQVWPHWSVMLTRSHLRPSCTGMDRVTKSLMVWGKTCRPSTTVSKIRFGSVESTNYSEKEGSSFGIEKKSQFSYTRIHFFMQGWAVLCPCDTYRRIQL